MRTWTEWRQNIDMTEGKQKMFKLAKQLKNERKDVIGGKYIKDEISNIEVNEVENFQRWNYDFNRLVNEENQHGIEQFPSVGPNIGNNGCYEKYEKQKSGKSIWIDNRYPENYWRN